MTVTIIPAAERFLADAASSADSAAALPLAPAAAPVSPPLRRLAALPYRAFPKQKEFHACAAKYRLFGGAAGPGKSKALLMEAIKHALDHPGSNSLLLRRTFPELESSLLLYFRRDVPRELYDSYNESRHTIAWRNGSTTRFGYSQSENDIYQYQSSEFLFIGIDELTHFTLRQWQFLTSRNRCPLPNTFPCMAGASNPGNIGHAWVKSLFIDKRPAAGMDPREYDPAEYAFISARVWDNPIYRADASYIKSLRQLPDFYRRAFLDGDWSVFAGQYFTNFDPSRHVIRAEAAAPQAWWPRWISVDWGFEHPAAAYWHTAPPFPRRAPQSQTETQQPQSQPARASFFPEGPPSPAPATYFGCHSERSEESAFAPDRDPRSRQTHAAGLPDPRPRVNTYREFIAQHLAPRDLAAAIIERSLASDGRLERIDAIYLSPDAFARRTDEASIAEQMGDVFAAAGFPRPVPADNDRIGGWMLMYQMLADSSWRVADSCPVLIRTLPELVRDSVSVEDISKCDGDDAADAARYGLKSRASAKFVRPPLEQEFQSRVTSSDPTIRAIQARKFQLDRRNPSAPVFPDRARSAPPRSSAPGNPRRRWPWS